MEKFKLRARRREIESTLITTVDVPCYQVSNPVAGEHGWKTKVFLPKQAMEARRIASRISLAMARKEEKDYYTHAAASIPSIKVPVIVKHFSGGRWGKRDAAEAEKKEHFFEIGFIKDSMTKKFFSLKYKQHSHRRQFSRRGFGELLQPPTIGSLAFWYLGSAADGSDYRYLRGAYKIHGNSLIDIVRAFNLIPNTELIAQDNMMIIPPPTPGAQEEIHPILDVDKLSMFDQRSVKTPVLTAKDSQHDYQHNTYSVNFTLNDTFLPLLNVWLKAHAPKAKSTSTEFYNTACSFWKEKTKP